MGKRGENPPRPRHCKRGAARIVPLLRRNGKALAKVTIRKSGDPPKGMERNSSRGEMLLNTCRLYGELRASPRYESGDFLLKGQRLILCLV